MKFGFKPLTHGDYFVSALLGMSMAFHGAMTASTLLGFNEPFTIKGCYVFIAIGVGILVFSKIEMERPNNENI